MPRRPSCPISPTAWAGKLALRSHSAANGLRRSSAKLRAMSRMIACSWLNSMTAASLPRDRTAVVVVEAAALGIVEPGNDAAQPADAFPDADCRLLSAHVAAHPARRQ